MSGGKTCGLTCIQMEEMYTDKVMTIQQIATFSNVGPRVVSRDLERCGIAKRKSPVCLTEQMLEQLYIHDKLSTTQIATRLHVGSGTVTTYLHRYGIPIRSRSEAVLLAIEQCRLVRVANAGSFKKGHKTWNKNMKGIHLSPQSEFKKGQKGITSVPVGTINERQCKNNKNRHFIKVAELNKWLEYARYLWEQTYGYIIEGDVIHHIDGDCLNDVIENLIAITRAEHPKIHGRWGLVELSQEQLERYKNRYKHKQHEQSTLFTPQGT